MNKKPWHKKAWKERRKELLASQCAWCGSTEKLVLHHTKLDHDNFEDYEKLDPSEVITICKRCHFAFHHQMDLCPVCKKFYKQMWFPTCYTCKDLPNTACTGQAVCTAKEDGSTSEPDTVKLVSSPACQ